jgi:hypothetical protein
MPTIDGLGGNLAWDVRANTSWRSDFQYEIDCTHPDLTGVTIEAKITDGELETTAVKTFTVVIDDAAEARWHILIPAAGADLDVGNYWWAMQWDLNGDVEPVCSGPFHVAPWSYA